MKGNVTEIVAHLRQFVPEVARKEHIRIAKEGLGKILSRNPDLPYRIIVDGRSSFSEESVKPFGVIRYYFIRMAQIAQFALNTAVDMSPVQSGRYKKSWVLIIDNHPYFTAVNIPPNTKQIILVNFQPYARKIHIRGARLRGVPPGIVEKVRSKTQNKFRSQVKVLMQYIELKGAYKLKNDYIQTRSNGTRRLHTRAGKELTYPALVITPRE